MLKDVQPDKDLPPMPKAVNISRVEKRINSLITGTRKWWGTTPEGEEFNDLIRDIMVDLPKVSFANVFMSLIHLAGRQLDKDILKAELWRLAANYELLQRQPVPPWTRQTRMEWAPVEITAATPGHDKYGRPGCWYNFKVLAGTATGKVIPAFWSYRKARHFGRYMGFTGFKSRPQLLMTDGRDLVGLRLYALLDPDRSRDDKPGFTNVGCPPSMVQYNKRILRQRMRVDPCPLGYSLSESPCHNCHVGYKNCMAGTHRNDWVAKFCPRCRQEGWFDPDGPGNACEACLDSQRRRKDEA